MNGQARDEVGPRSSEEKLVGPWPSKHDQLTQPERSGWVVRGSREAPGVVGMVLPYSTVQESGMLLHGCRV